MKKYLYMLFILGIILIFTGCSENNYSKIDWVDFVQISDNKYVRNNYIDTISSDLIGNKVDNVKFNVADNVYDSNYKIKNGDAAFLKEGTELYKLKDYSENFRIAAKVDNEYRLYEVSDNPNSQKIRDILDIENKVTYIGINSEKDGATELGVIKDNEKVKLLVDMILNTDVKKENYSLDGKQYFIDFHLKDGTSVVRSLNIETGNFHNKTIMNEDFMREIRTIINESLFNLSSFKENLDKLGYTYMENKWNGNSFLSVNATSIQIDKEYIGIYQYNSHDYMEKDAKLISWDGTSTGYVEISWASKPHFYKKGSIIVAYAGKN